MKPYVEKKCNYRIWMNYIIIGILSIFYIPATLWMFYANESSRLSYFSIGLATLSLIQAAGSVIDSLKTNKENTQNNIQVVNLLNTQTIILERLEKEVESLKNEIKNDSHKLESSIDNTKTLILNSKKEITDSLNSKNYRREKEISFLTVNFHSNKDPE